MVIPIQSTEKTSPNTAKNEITSDSFPFRYTKRGGIVYTNCIFLVLMLLNIDAYSGFMYMLEYKKHPDRLSQHPHYQSSYFNGKIYFLFIPPANIDKFCVNTL